MPMNEQQLDRFTVIELAVDELGSWMDGNGMDKSDVRYACWKISHWLHYKLASEQTLEGRRDRVLRIRKQLTELFPLDDK